MNGAREQEFLENDGGVTWRFQPDGRERAAHAPNSTITRGGIARAIGAKLEAAWAICGPFEWVALTYLAVLSALILIFIENLAHPFRLLTVQALVGLLILSVCRAEANTWSDAPISRRGRDETWGRGNRTLTQRFWHFWRHWYPHLFFLFCFEELGYLMRLITPEWQDPKLIAFDHWLTGVHPSIWLEQFAAPAGNEFMQFAYVTYFVYLLVLGGILYHRKDWRGYWAVMTYSAAAYAIGYTIAIFFPVESPWFAMAGTWHGELRGGAFTSLINFIEHYGRVRGAAFPSEHVAGSVAALWGAWKHRRWLFWIMLPLALCMCVSTVWGRYHYVADVFAGIVTGTLGYVVGAWVMKQGDRRALEARITAQSRAGGACNL